MKVKLIGASLLVSSTLYSASDSELNKREKIAAVKVSGANSLDRSYGYYQKVRDSYFYGDAGIQPRSEAFFESTSKWFDGWSSLLAVVDLEDIELGQIFSKIETRLESQSAELYELNLEALAIAKAGKKARVLLQKNKTIGNGRPT